MSNDNASLLILGWFIFAIIYSGVINRVRNIDVTPIGRVFAAFVGILMWAPIYDADKFNISLIFYAIIPVLILLVIFLLNYNDTQSILHAALMTMVQYSIGFLLVGLLSQVSLSGKKKNKKN